MPLLSTSQRHMTQTDPSNPLKPNKSAWEYYLEISGIEDTEREREWQDLLDVILVFSALFASFLSTFIVQTLNLLQANPLDSIQDILLYQTLVMQNRTSEPYVAPEFSPPQHAIVVNALFFASLGVILVAAFLCVIIKGWVRELDRRLRGIPDVKKRAVIKELREQGLIRWRFPGLITILPTLIHISLILFFVGLAVYLLQIHRLLAFLSISIFGIGMLLFVLSAFISTIDDFSPFRSPYSRAFGVLYRHLYSRFGTFRISFSVFALPQTTSEKALERIITFIKEHKPSSEQTIADPTLSIPDEIISRASVPILDKLNSLIGTDKWDASVHPSAYSENLFTSILLQLDDPNIRPPGYWSWFYRYDVSSLSIQEAKCLASGICMQSEHAINKKLVRNMRAAVVVLDQSSDPWCQLLASLIQARAGHEQFSSSETDPSRLFWKPSFAAREADIQQAISNVERFSAAQWFFVLRWVSQW